MKIIEKFVSKADLLLSGISIVFIIVLLLISLFIIYKILEKYAVHFTFVLNFLSVKSWNRQRNRMNEKNGIRSKKNVFNIYNSIESALSYSSDAKDYKSNWHKDKNPEYLPEQKGILELAQTKIKDGDFDTAIKMLYDMLLLDQEYGITLKNVAFEFLKYEQYEQSNNSYYYAYEILKKVGEADEYKNDFFEICFALSLTNINLMQKKIARQYYVDAWKHYNLIIKKGNFSIVNFFEFLKETKRIRQQYNSSLVGQNNYSNNLNSSIEKIYQKYKRRFFTAAVLNTISSLLYKTNKVDLAIRYSERSLQANPLNEVALSNRIAYKSELTLKKHKFERYSDDYDFAVKMNSDFYLPHYNYSIAEWNRKEYISAMRAGLNAWRMKEDNVEILWLGMVSILQAMTHGIDLLNNIEGDHILALYKYLEKKSDVGLFVKTIFRNQDRYVDRIYLPEINLNPDDKKYVKHFYSARSIGLKDNYEDYQRSKRNEGLTVDYYYFEFQPFKYIWKTENPKKDFITTTKTQKYYSVRELRVDQIKTLNIKAPTPQVIIPGINKVERFTLIGQIYLSSKNYVLAEQIFNQILEIDYTNNDAVSGLAKILSIKEEYQEIIDLIAKHYANAELNTQLMLCKVSSLIKLKRYKIALTDVEKAIKTNSEDASLNLYHELCKYKIYKAPVNIEYVQSLLQHLPDEIKRDAHLLIAEGYYLIKDFQQARTSFIDFNERYGSNSETLLKAGLSCIQLDQISTGVDCFSQIQDISDIPNKEKLKIGLFLERNNEYIKALRYIKDFDIEELKNIKTLSAFAKIYYKNKNYSIAEHLYRNLNKLEPNNAGFLYCLGVSLLRNDYSFDIGLNYIKEANALGWIDNYDAIDYAEDCLRNSEYYFSTEILNVIKKLNPTINENELYAKYKNDEISNQESVQISKELIPQLEYLKRLESETQRYAQNNPVNDKYCYSGLVDEPFKNIEDPKIIESYQDRNFKFIKRIGFDPEINSLIQKLLPNRYPIVKLPLKNSIIKFPRKGRSNKRGFLEGAFYNMIKNHFKAPFVVANDRHVPNKSKHPYEPDCVIYNEKNSKNIFIDIEIDEPYDGYARNPTHVLGWGTQRDDFFTKRGWVVIRFSEYQICKESLSCISFIEKVINSLDNSFQPSINTNLIRAYECWDLETAYEWADSNYREEYLGIREFGKIPDFECEYQIESSDLDDETEDFVEDDSKTHITVNEPRTAFGNKQKVRFSTRDKRLTFYEDEHRYFIDKEFEAISVTKLIEHFFEEFDSNYWSHRKAIDYCVANQISNNSVNIEFHKQRLLSEWDKSNIEALELGQALHKDIEKFYRNNAYYSDSTEFSYFKNFVEKYNVLKPFRSEWRIFDDEHRIAGTVDMIYEDVKGQYHLFDWKRSKRVVDDNGSPILHDYRYGNDYLNNVADNDYNKYSLQLNIYKKILESKYNIKISSMSLLIMHPKYDNYIHRYVHNMQNYAELLINDAKNYI